MIDNLHQLQSNMQDNVEVFFAKLHEDAYTPTRGSKFASGWDLYALEETVVSKEKSSKIRTGIALAIPEGWEGQLRSRSSLGAKGMIMPNGIGTIDADYRGELLVLSVWIGEGDSITIQKGERVAQLVIAPVPETKFTEMNVEDLPTTERGSGGFGSSGRF